MYKGVELPPIKEARGSNDDTNLHTYHRLTSHKVLGDVLKQTGTRGRQSKAGDYRHQSTKREKSSPNLEDSDETWGRIRDGEIEQ